MFVDAQSKVDREGLRNHVLSRLQSFHQRADHLCVDKANYWSSVELAAKKYLPVKDQQKVIQLVKQIKSLPGYIDGWINLSVDTDERFEFFILTKAHELNSGDQAKDYFWALQIRHDQLVALVRVLDILLDKLKLWTELRPEAVFDDPVFAGLTDYGLEDQVYIEAEKVYKERTQLMQAAT